jgi:prepilin-type N-terminal cleavage/methylation domain-containing protein/prepilin-type processing-associated H-X9-DG protein
MGAALSGSAGFPVPQRPGAGDRRALRWRPGGLAPRISLPRGCSASGPHGHATSPARLLRCRVRGASGREGNRGFTLIELLVVVALLAVLAGLLLPVLARAREEGRRVTCLSNLRQISQAHLMYVQDWEERLAPWYVSGLPPPQMPSMFPFVTWPPRDEAAGPVSFWTEYLQPYLRSTAVLRDPSLAWLGTWPGTRLADYAIFTWGWGGQGTPESPHWCWAGPHMALAAVQRPTETAHVMDGVTTTQVSSLEQGRHHDGTNVSFLDGHVRWLPDKEMARVDTDGRGFYWLHYAAADQ